MKFQNSIGYTLQSEDIETQKKFYEKRRAKMRRVEQNNFIVVGIFCVFYHVPRHLAEICVYTHFGNQISSWNISSSSSESTWYRAQSFNVNFHFDCCDKRADSSRKIFHVSMAEKVKTIQQCWMGLKSKPTGPSEIRDKDFFYFFFNMHSAGANIFQCQIKSREATQQQRTTDQNETKRIEWGWKWRGVISAAQSARVSRLKLKMTKLMCKKKKRQRLNLNNRGRLSQWIGIFILLFPSHFATTF